MTLGELFEETYIQGEIAIRSYDSTGTTIEHYLGDAEEFYPDEHPQILEREVGYIFPLMEVEPTICIEGVESRVVECAGIPHSYNLGSG